MFNHYRIHFNLLSKNVKLFLLGHALLGFGHSIYSLLLNLYLRELGYKEGFIGNLASTTSLGMALIAFPAALVLERFHVKPLVKWGIFLAGSSYFFQVWSSQAELLLFFGLLGAMGLALFNISVSPFIYRNSTGATRFTLYSLNSCVLMISHFMGSMLGGILPENIAKLFSLEKNPNCFQYAILFGLLLMSLSYFIFSKLEKKPIPRVKRSFLAGIKNKEWATIIKLLIPKFAIAFGAGIIIPFMNLYLKENLYFKTREIGWAFSGLQICIFIGVFLSPFLVRKIKSLNLIIFTCLLSVPFMLLISTTNNVVVLGSFFIRGMLMNMAGPLTSLFEMEHVKEEDRVFVSALLVFSYNISWTLSTQIGGFLIENYSFKYSFYVASFFYALSALFYYVFFSKEKMKTEKVDVPETDQLAA